MYGPYFFSSLNSGLEINKEEGTKTRFVTDLSRPTRIA